MIEQFLGRFESSPPPLAEVISIRREGFRADPCLIQDGGEQAEPVLILFLYSAGTMADVPLGFASFFNS